MPCDRASRKTAAVVPATGSGCGSAAKNPMAACHFAIESGGVNLRARFSFSTRSGARDDREPPFPQYHRGRCPRPQSFDVLRDGLSLDRLRQSDDRHRQRPLDDHPLQFRTSAARRRRRGRGPRSRRQSADLRHPHDLGRHVDGHRRHEVFADLARSHCRLRRDRGSGPVDGWRAGARRLRQEHARRHDRHPALQCAGDLCLWRHDQARPLEGQGPHCGLGLRSGRRVFPRSNEQRGLRRYRKKCRAGHRLLRRHVHRQHHVLLVRGARHEPARLLDHGQPGRRKARLDCRISARTGAGGAQQSAPARHRHP